MFVDFAVSLIELGAVLIYVGSEASAEIDGLPVRADSAEGTVVELVEDSKK